MKTSYNEKINKTGDSQPKLIRKKRESKKLPISTLKEEPTQ